MAQARRDMGELRPIDDLMFRVMARDEAFCGELLGVLLQDPKLEVVECEPQSAVTNPHGRSVVLEKLQKFRACKWCVALVSKALSVSTGMCPVCIRSAPL